MAKLKDLRVYGKAERNTGYDTPNADYGLPLEIRFCENTQLIPLRRGHVNRALPVTLRRLFLWIIRGFRLRLHPRLSNVVHLRRTCSTLEAGLKNEFLETAYSF